jgi:hypothetical protein
LGALEWISGPYATKAEAEEERIRQRAHVDAMHAHRHQILEQLQNEDAVTQRPLNAGGRPWSVPLSKCEYHITWVNPDYALHHAICPVCGFDADIRAYFQGEPECSLDRMLTACRIKCNGPPNNVADLDMSTCSVGTGNGAGLYLYPPESCRDSRWTLEFAREYLESVGSPLASHLAFCADHDRAQSNAIDASTGATERPKLMK